jgi:hypothetical protein
VGTLATASRRAGSLSPSYQAVRALFSWTSPLSVTLSLVLAPLFQVVFFAVVGNRIAHVPTESLVVGLCALTPGYVTVFGSVMLVAYDRRQATWVYVLTSRRALAKVLLGRGLALAALGAVLGMVVLALAGFVLTGGTAVTGRAVAAVLSVAGSSVGVSLLVGLLVRRSAEPLIHANLAFGALMLLCGAVADPVGPLTALAHALPATAAIGVARGELPVLGGVALESAVGLAWWVAALVCAALVAHRRDGKDVS